MSPWREGGGAHILITRPVADPAGEHKYAPPPILLGHKTQSYHTSRTLPSFLGAPPSPSWVYLYVVQLFINIENLQNCLPNLCKFLLFCILFLLVFSPC